MRILYLFGNGFDLHVGLHTGYRDFLKYYLQQPEPAELDEVGKRFIKRLKEDIKDNIELWSDLELQLGRHTEKFGGMGSSVHSLEEEMDIVNDDIRDNLSRYISQEDKKAIFTESDCSQYQKELISPELHLRDFEKDTIKYCKSKMWNGTSNIIDIITFNYTRTIERLLDNASKQVSGFQINMPVHVHGYFDERMILGVNDQSQIANKELCKSTYATDALIKADCNHTYGVSHTNQCASLIANAQLLCCYGLSLGNTDKMWWKKICEELKKRGELIVILFVHKPDIIDYSNNGHKRQRVIRYIANRLLTQGEVAEPERKNLLGRIYVSINDSIFGIHIDEVSLLERQVLNTTPPHNDGLTPLSEVI